MAPDAVIDVVLGGCLLGIAAVLGIAVVRVVQRARRAEERAEKLAERNHQLEERHDVELERGQQIVDLGALSKTMRVLAGAADPSAARVAVCEGVRSVAAAPVAALFEGNRDGSALTVAAATGADLRGLLIPFAGEISKAAQAFSGGEPIFVPDAPRSAGADLQFTARCRADSVLWYPVVRDGVSVGLLAVAWRSRIARPSPRLVPLIDVLAAEAAVAEGRAELLDRFERIARTDDLTGLPNRRAWEEELPRELARAWRQDTAVCVAMLDLDGFKAFNDERGHQAGDRLLKEAAGAWRSALRPYDLLARYGGEEFGVILPGCGLADGIAIVDRLRAATPAGVSCSGGIAEWDCEEHPEGLVGRADGALYEAKRTGRDRTVSAQVRH